MFSTTSSRRRLLAVASAGAAITAGMLGAATASPAPAASDAAGAARAVVFSKFEALHSGQVFDVANASPSSGAAVNQFPFHGGTNQQWQKIFVTNTPPGQFTGDFVLRTRNSNLCLDVKGRSKAASVPLEQRPCDLSGGTPSQRWFTHKVADKGLLTGKGYRFHFNRNSGMVIDVANASQQPGASLVQFPEKPLPSAGNQLFNEGFGGVG